MRALQSPVVFRRAKNDAERAKFPLDFAQPPGNKPKWAGRLRTDYDAGRAALDATRTSGEATEPAGIGPKPDGAVFALPGEAMSGNRNDRHAAVNRKRGLSRAEIERTQELVIAEPAGESDHVALRGQEVDVALYQRRMVGPKRQHAPVVFENRIRVALLRVDGERYVLGRHRQPGLAGGKAGIRLVRIPHHRRAAAVAPLVFGPEADAVGVVQVFEGQIGFGQPKFLAL